MNKTQYSKWLKQHLLNCMQAWLDGKITTTVFRARILYHGGEYGERLVSYVSQLDRYAPDYHHQRDPYPPVHGV